MKNSQKYNVKLFSYSKFSKKVASKIQFRPDLIFSLQCPIKIPKNVSIIKSQLKNQENVINSIKLEPA